MRNVPPTLVFTFHTPLPHRRETAQQLLRQQLSTLLSPILHHPNIQLQSAPGEKPQLAPPFSAIGISISHAPGRTLLAINPHGPVGIDIIHLDPNINWQQLAPHYFSPQTIEHILSQPASERSAHFHQAWTRLEATLKCHGMPLCEWHPAIEPLYQQTQHTHLSLPNNWIGCLTWGNRNR